MQLTKNARTYTTYDITPKKSKSKTFHFKKMQTRVTWHIFWGFEQLFSSVAWQVTDLQSGAKIWA